MKLTEKKRKKKTLKLKWSVLQACKLAFSCITIYDSKREEENGREELDQSLNGLIIL